jgi:N-sulfoglucosamine sulfohydrolase
MALYDLAKDRDQVRNVADDPNYATIRENLEQRLMEELKRTGDPRLVDDGKYYETPPMSGPIDDAEGRAKPGEKKKGGKGKGKAAASQE